MTLNLSFIHVQGDRHVTMIPNNDVPVIALIIDACFGLLNPGADLFENDDEIMGLPIEGGIFDS